MASISRLCFRAGLLRKIIYQSNAIRIAGISTSKKNKDTTSITTTTPHHLFTDALPEKFDARKTNKHWVSWGWDLEDREVDVTFVHLFFFMMVTVCIVGGGYYMAYCPSKYMHDWSQREAFLQLRYREANGLPLVDPNLIPLEEMLGSLPSDEELGDTEVII